MDEREQQELTMQEEQSAAPEKKKVTVKEAQDRTRRNVLHGVCGAYLLYLAWQLAKGLPEILAKGWTVGGIVPLIGLVVFTVMGIWLLVSVVLRVVRQSRESRDNTEE